MNEEIINQAKDAFGILASLIGQLSDTEFGVLVNTGAFDNLLTAILEPSDVEKYPNIAEFFLANKMRLALLALLRIAITQNGVVA